MWFVSSAAQRLPAHPEHDLMLGGFSTGYQAVTTRESLLNFPPRTGIPSTAEITGNFLDRPTDGLKTEASCFRILTQLALTQRAVGFLWFLGGSIFGQHESYLGYVARCRLLEPGVEVGALGFNHPHRWVPALFSLLRFSATMRLCVRLSGNRLDVSALICAALLNSPLCWRFMWHPVVMRGLFYESTLFWCRYQTWDGSQAAFLALTLL